MSYSIIAVVGAILCCIGWGLGFYLSLLHGRSESRCAELHSALLLARRRLMDYHGAEVALRGIDNPICSPEDFEQIDAALACTKERE